MERKRVPERFLIGDTMRQFLFEIWGAEETHGQLLVMM